MFMRMQCSYVCMYSCIVNSNTFYGCREEATFTEHTKSYQLERGPDPQPSLRPRLLYHLSYRVVGYLVFWKSLTCLCRLISIISFCLLSEERRYANHWLLIFELGRYSWETNIGSRVGLLWHALSNSVVCDRWLCRYMDIRIAYCVGCSCSISLQ
jgi:hypothetical protein